MSDIVKIWSDKNFKKNLKRACCDENMTLIEGTKILSTQDLRMLIKNNKMQKKRGLNIEF